MNNYLRLLLFLKQHDGDGKFHNIEPLFSEISLSQMKAIIGELDQEGLIKFIGRETRYDEFIVEVNQLTGKTKWTESPINELHDKIPPIPLSAKITFKGSKYLKEELEMQQTGKYNINIGDGSTANLILDSNSSTINNYNQVQQKIDEIINVIQEDSNIDIKAKSQLLESLSKASSEIVAQKAISKTTLKDILTRGAEISSIGSLLASLAQMLL